MPSKLNFDSFCFLNSGLFAKVYQVSDDTVVKKCRVGYWSITKSFDPYSMCFLSFVRRIRNIRNPHFPKIHTIGRKYIENEEWYVNVFMEKLRSQKISQLLRKLTDFRSF